MRVSPRSKAREKVLERRAKKVRKKGAQNYYK